MDDSDLDFADLCSKLLKRVRKKEKGDSGDERRKEASQNLTQNTEPAPSQSKDSTKRRKAKQDAELATWKQLDCRSAGASQFNSPAGEESTGQPCTSVAVPQTPSSQAAVEPGAAGLSLGARQNGHVNMRAKDKVVSRMQQFRWVSPQKMTHVENDHPERIALDAEDRTAQSAAPQAVDLLQGPLGDEALALRLQEELDQEARGPGEPVDLEQGGLFFCQICQRDLSALSPLRRTQHINRCLDESEGSGPAAPAPPAVPECPICGKMFKSQKSRASHLKRCSAEMGVAPALLLQALQRQATDTASDSAANQPPPAGGSKRKGSSDPPRPPKKRQRKKAPPLDEDTMVALALSRSMVEQERERDREALFAPPAADTLSLQWRAEAGKRRGQKKGRPPAPPPLLLVQEPGEALRRLQDRVSALLLRNHPPAPPTPPRPACTLPGWSGTAPLWQRSALRDTGLGSAEEFYTPALCPPVQPCAPTTEKVAPPTQAVVFAPAEPPRPAPSTPGVGSQTLGDLMDLAEEGLTLTQWGYTPKPDCAPTLDPTEDRDPGVADLQLSGFLPERPHTASASSNTGALSRLTADLSTMVNNPQLSDVQLQVDSGEVFFAHSFMLYARCPLLVRMVHDSGFGVEEEGMPSAQRVLLGDVSPEAVRVLLQYLYCARCPLTPGLLPHLQGLALRLDLGELLQVCQSYSGGAAVRQWAESREPERREEEQEEEEECGQHKFLELLRSMWEEEDAEEGGGGDGEEMEGGAEGRVHEEELQEIYEFAATQRKTVIKEEEENAAMETEEEEEEERKNAALETEEEEEEERKNAAIETEEEEEEDREKRVRMASRRLSYCPTPHSARSQTEPPDWPSTSHMTQEDSEAERAVRSGPVGAGADGTSQSSPGQRSHSSLDRSYERLFSQTWGDYMETSHQRSHGELIDLSISPVPDPCGPTFPTAGQSPGTPARLQESPARLQESPVCLQESPARLQESPVCLQESPARLQESPVCLQESPARLQESPALLQESPVCLQESPARLQESPVRLQESPVCLQESPARLQESPVCLQESPARLQVSPPRARPEPVLIQLSDSGEEQDTSPPQRALSSPGDCSAEMSWLIPGTPEREPRATRVMSTQTHCSMRRTRLFSTRSSPLSSPLSSPRSSPLSRPTASVAPGARLSPPTPATDPAHSLSSHTPISTAPPRQPGGPFSDPARPKPPALSHVSYCSTPPPLHPSSCPSSTPLPPDPSSCPTSTPLPPDPSSCPTSTPLPPDPSSCPSSTSLGRPVPKRSERPLQSVSCGATLRLRLSSSSPPSPRKRGSPEDERGEGGVEEEGASPPQMEDPPMAFDESWGLDAGGGRDPCFSLRLDSSAWASQSEQGSAETTPPAAPPPLSPSPGNQVHPYTSLLESKIWEDWEEEEDGAVLPLSQRVRQLKTPVASHRKGQAPLVPITPMPGYSDMDTPELKNKLNRFGVRPLPRRQMVLKLKEIHQYTHQLQSSESEEDAPAHRPRPSSVSTAFKQPERPAAAEAWHKGSSHKEAGPEEEGEGLSASQGSTASSTAASEDSERWNPEQCWDSEGSESEGVTASQAGVRGQEKLQAVRTLIKSDPLLYGQVLRYEPLVLTQLQARLRSQGIRLGAAKLLDFLDSQCITVTTAKPTGPAGPPRPRPARARARGRARGRGRGRGRAGAAKASH